MYMASHDAYEDPIYNLKAVVEQTGVSADALRAWERRYGLPLPSRTEAGHRSYSQRDIDAIKWLVARQDEGLRIGRAVKLWKTLKEEGQDPLRSMPLPADGRVRREVAGQTIASLRDEWVSASLRFDERAAQSALTQALAVYPPDRACSQVILAGVAEIGRRWYSGEVTAHQEHFASQLAIRRLQTLLQAAPPPTRRGRVLTACPPHEEHSLGLLAFSLLLRRAGWSVTYLGPNVPCQRLEEAVVATEPSLMVMAAHQLHTAASLLEVAKLLENREIVLAFGGHIFDQGLGISDCVPGYFLGPDVDRAVREAERLLTMPLRIPDVDARCREDKRARAAYRRHRAALEADVEKGFEDLAIDPQALQELNEILGGAIDAALAFGDIGLADYQLDWLYALHPGHRPSGEQLDDYLEVYSSAAERVLDETGAVVVGWLRDKAGGRWHAERRTDDS